MNNSIRLLIALCVYYLSLVYAYQYFMLPVWGEDFLEVRWGLKPSWNIFFIVNTIIYIIASIYISRRRSRPSDFIHIIFFAFPIAPMLIISSFKGQGFLIAYGAIFALLLSCFVTRLRYVPISFSSKVNVFDKNNYLIFCTIIGAVIIVLSVLKGGMSFLNFDFTKVYEYRRAASSSRGVLLNYLILNYIGILLPLGVAISLAMKRYFILLLLLIINMLIAALTSSKAYFFVSMFTIFIYLVSSNRNRSGYYFLMVISGILSFLVTLYMIFPSSEFLGTLFIRRYAFVPAYVNFLYWDFFSINEYAFWADSSISMGLIDSTYGKPTPQVIGDFYSGVDFSLTEQEFNNANTGLIGSGYGNAGLLGIWFYALLSGFVLRYCNNFSSFLGYRISIASIGFYFFAIFYTSTDLPAAMLSYGMISYMILYFLWKKD
ncbi:O-antigen polymerase [Vibrio splendidus]